MYTLRKLWKNECGQDLIEYALVAAFAATAAPAIWGTQYMSRLAAIVRKVEELLAFCISG